MHSCVIVWFVLVDNSWLSYVFTIMKRNWLLICQNPNGHLRHMPVDYMYVTCQKYIRHTDRSRRCSVHYRENSMAGHESKEKKGCPCTRVFCYFCECHFITLFTRLCTCRSSRCFSMYLSCSLNHWEWFCCENKHSYCYHTCLLMPWKKACSEANLFFTRLLTFNISSWKCYT